MSAEHNPSQVPPVGVAERISRVSTVAVRQAGLSLIELIIFIVVVSVGLAGVLAVFNTTVRNSADALVVKQAMAIANSMMDEVLQKDFANPAGGWTASVPFVVAERASYDDVGDFNGYGPAAIYALSDLSSPITSLSAYTVAVAVLNPAAAIGGVPASDVKVVTITVAYPGANFVLTGYRFNYD